MGKNGGILNVIRCDEPDYLIWKWQPPVVDGKKSNRENEIRWGSSLRVKDGSVAVFVYKQKSGLMQDYIEGPFDEMISTKNLPILANIIGAFYDGKSPFQAEIYFINLARVIQTKIAVPYFDIYDTRFQDFSVPVAVRGTVTYKIKNYKEFIKLHRLENFDIETFNKQIRDAVSKYVKNAVANVPQKNAISVLQIEQKISLISELINNDITTQFAEDFGVEISNVDISAIDVDKSSESYYRLKSITQDITFAKERAKATAEVKNIQDLQRVNMENYEESLRIQREEGRYAQHMQIQSANLAAYQTEKQTEVGVAGASALGKMGSNGAGTVNMDGSNGGGGFNAAAFMTSMAMGGVVAQNVAGTMKNAMGEVNQAVGTVPPPIPETVYNVAQNGQAIGPFNFTTLMQMAQAGQFNGQSLVWKPGMQNWQKAESVDELKDVLTSVPPAVPNN